MRAIELIGLLVGSSVVAALITQGGGLLLERLKHKNAKEDRAEEKEKRRHGQAQRNRRQANEAYRV